MFQGREVILKLAHGPLGQEEDKKQVFPNSLTEHLLVLSHPPPCPLQFYRMPASKMTARLEHLTAHMVEVKTPHPRSAL